MSALWERVDYKLYIPCNIHVYVDMMLIFQQMSNASSPFQKKKKGEAMQCKLEKKGKRGMRQVISAMG